MARASPRDCLPIIPLVQGVSSAEGSQERSKRTSSHHAKVTTCGTILGCPVFRSFTVSTRACSCFAVGYVAVLSGLLESCCVGSAQVFGRTTRRQAVTKLRARTLNGGGSDGGPYNRKDDTLTDVLDNRTATIHSSSDGVHASRVTIALDHHASFMKLDLEKVSLGRDLSRTQKGQVHSECGTNGRHR